MRRIHRWPVNSPHKGPVTRKMFPFADVIICMSDNIVVTDTPVLKHQTFSSHNPAGTRRNNNVFTTSTRRRRRRVDVVKTLSLRHYCIMCPLGICHRTRLSKRCRKNELFRMRTHQCSSWWRVGQYFRGSIGMLNFPDIWLYTKLIFCCWQALSADKLVRSPASPLLAQLFV